jgi:hypothetical protein
MTFGGQGPYTPQNPTQARVQHRKVGRGAIAALGASVIMVVVAVAALALHLSPFRPSSAVSTPTHSSSPPESPRPFACAVSPPPVVNGEPPARWRSVAAYDAASKTVLMFGGETKTGFLDDTWTWNGRSWLRWTLSARPTPRSRPAMAYDAPRQKVVLYGGQDRYLSVPGLPYLHDTWLWNGCSWRRADPALSPVVSDAVMTFDARSGKIVLFGLTLGGPVTAETWTWNGITWSKRENVNNPPGRLGASMAYDPGTKRVLLFGGWNNSAGSLNDTWAWDGTRWTQLHPSSSPSARDQAAMTGDVASGHIVLFGGNSGGADSDTWIWLGSDWVQAHPQHSPPGRDGAAFTSDASSGQELLFGGFQVNGSIGTPSSDTWKWSSTDWQQAESVP